MLGEGLNPSQAASRLGISTELLAAALAGRPVRWADRLGDDMLEVIEGRDLVNCWETASDFVLTDFAKAIFGLLEDTWAHGRMVVVMGGAGTGKTTAAQQFETGHPGAVVYVRAVPGMQLKKFLGAIGAAIGLRTTSDVFDAQWQIAREWNRFNYLLLLDESDFLTPSSFSALRSVWDEAQRGLVCLGTLDWLRRLGKKHGEAGTMDQFLNRFDRRLVIERLEDKDVRTFGRARGIEGPALNALVAGARGCLRRARQAIEYCRNEVGEVSEGAMREAFSVLPSLDRL